MENSTQKQRKHHYRMIVLFHLRYGKKDKTKGQIYLRVSVDGKRAPEKSLNIAIDAKDWNKERQNVAPNHQQAQSHNARINTLRTDFDDAYNFIKRSDKPITPKRLMNFVFGNGNDLDTLKGVFESYLAERTPNITASTANSIQKRFRVLERFFEQQRSKNVYMQDLERTTCTKLHNWLKDKYGDGYTKKAIGLLKSITTYAVAQNIIYTDPFRNMPFKFEENYNTEHLSQSEVRKLYNFDFSTLPTPITTAQALEQERDMFVFCCYTGMHHADYTNKNYEIYEYNNRTWIKGQRTKTSHGYALPIHDIAVEIINKYGGIENLPIRNNAQRNQNLKIIAANVGLSINLVTKTARKTLASYALNDLKARAETVAEILGHTTTKYVKYYAKITHETIDREMVY